MRVLLVCLLLVLASSRGKPTSISTDSMISGDTTPSSKTKTTSDKTEVKAAETSTNSDDGKAKVQNQGDAKLETVDKDEAPVKDAKTSTDSDEGKVKDEAPVKDAKTSTDSDEGKVKDEAPVKAAKTSTDSDEGKAKVQDKDETQSDKDEARSDKDEDALSKSLASAPAKDMTPHAESDSCALHPPADAPVSAGPGVASTPMPTQPIVVLTPAEVTSSFLPPPPPAEAAKLEAILSEGTGKGRSSPDVPVTVAGQEVAVVEDCDTTVSPVQGANSVRSRSFLQS